MKARRFQFLLLTFVLAFVGADGLWVWKAKRQYALNRELIAALVHNDGKTAFALVNAGADPNTRCNPPPFPTLTLLLNQLLHRSPPPNDNDPTAFMFVCGAVWDASHQLNQLEHYNSEDLPLLRAMLLHGASCKATDDTDQYALHHAASSHHLKVAQLFLEHGANINAQDIFGRTPLMWAVLKPDTNMTRLLLEHGANITLTDVGGSSALHLAVENGLDREGLRLLLAKGANPYLDDGNGDTPLTLAQEQNHPDLVALLREKR